MKKITLFILSFLWIISCSTSEKQKENKTTQSYFAKNFSGFSTGPFSNLKGDTIWQQNNAFIMVVKSETPQVLFGGYSRIKVLSLKKLKVYGENYHYLLNGTIKEFGDLERDGSPEFLIEYLTTKGQVTEGYRVVISPAQAPLLHAVYDTEVYMELGDCPNFVGSNEVLTYDDTSEDSPYLATKGIFGLKLDDDTDCNSYQKAEATMHFYQEKDVTYSKRSKEGCIVENGVIDLGKLYGYKITDFRDKKFQQFDYYRREDIHNKFKGCDKPPIETLSSLKGLKDVDPNNNNLYKRTDLMPYLKDEFTNINGEGVKWARNNLVPAPDQKQVNGLLYQFVYDLGYRTRVRTVALARLLIEQEDIEPLLVEYVDAKATKFFDESTQQVITKEKENSLIKDKFWWLIGKLNKMDLYGGSLKRFDYGFWMRRMLDGSDPEIWELLKHILKLYDNEWYKEAGVYNLVKIDSTTYRQAFLLADGYKFKNKTEVPTDIKIGTINGVSIAARNKEVITFTNNVQDGKNIARYSIKGYWPERETIVLSHIGLEWKSNILVDINTGKTTDFEWSLSPSKNGKQVAEIKNDFGRISLQLSKLKNEKESPYFSISNSGFKGQIEEGFWVGDDYYFVKKKDTTQETLFYKVGKLGLDDIKPHIPKSQ